VISIGSIFGSYISETIILAIVRSIHCCETSTPCYYILCKRRMRALEIFEKFDADIRELYSGTCNLYFGAASLGLNFARNGEPNYDSRDVSLRDSHVAVSNTGVFVCYR